MKIIDSEHNKTDKFIVLTKREAVELIGLLAGHLANEAMPGRQHGACPTFNYDMGSKRMTFSVEIEKSG